MKTIGLIGGMSWKSTATYYDKINELINRHLGNDHSAKLALVSVDFQEVLKYQENRDWQGVYDVLLPYVNQLIKTGAEFIAITSNTIHQVADKLEEEFQLPLIGIGEAVAGELKVLKIKKAGLLGTALTMDGDYYPKTFTRHGLEIILPSAQKIRQIDQLIFSELIKGKAGVSGSNLILESCRELKNAGAEAIVLGCTELGMIDMTSLCGDLVIIDSLHAHCRSIVQAALSK